MADKTVEVEEPIVAEPDPNPEPESEAEPLPDLPVEVLSESQAAVRTKADEANADLQPGQTLLTTTDGDVIVSGLATAVPVGEHTLEPGDSVALNTPAGAVVVGVETADDGRVWVTARMADRDGVESDTILLRAGP